MSFEQLGERYALMVATVTIDAADALTLAQWWADLLGVDYQDFGGGYVAVRPQQGGRANLGFQQVPEPKTVKNRVHVDFVVRDLDAASATIVEAGGAEVAHHDFEGFVWRVMTDPEGNEFCIVLHES